MFNWYAAPTFFAMFCFWLLASYVLTRSPRSPITVLAVAVQMATAAYLLGQGMQANATSLDDWRPWARNLQWGATVAPTLWYWLTILLLRDQQHASAERYLRRFGQPLGVVFAAATVVLTIAIYADDWLYRWSSPMPIPVSSAAYYHFEVLPGPVYPAVIVFLAGTTIGAMVNLWLARRLPIDEERRRRFGWLLASAVLFIVGANCLGVAHALLLPFWTIWVGHLVLAGAMVVMASNVAAYGLVLDVEVIRTDLFFFLTSLTIATVAYAVVIAVMKPGFSFQLVALVMVVLMVTILFYALFDVGRHLLDRLFFGPEVQRLRSNLSVVVQTAAVAPDLSVVLEEAQAEIAEVSAEHMVRLTEEALRRFNSPSGLARCGLADRLPHTMAATRPRREGDKAAEATPLEQAQAIRAVLTAAIERLKPADRAPAGSPGTLQYHILHGEYVQGMPIKHLMVRHSISESTFHRQRRDAIAILAQELSRQERLRGQAQGRST